MSGPPWIELHIADYMADTIGLSHREHGSYLLSIMAYWQKGEALTSKELNDVCGRDVDKVSRFYIWENGKWHHKRIDKELRKVLEKLETQRMKLEKMMAARRRLGQIPEKQ